MRACRHTCKHATNSPRASRCRGVASWRLQEVDEDLLAKHIVSDLCAWACRRPPPFASAMASLQTSRHAHRLFMICLLASCVQGDIFYDMGTHGVAGLEMQIHAACGLTRTPTSKSHLEVHVHVLGPYGGQSSQITIGPIASRGHRQHVHVCACVYNVH